ncbi:Gfo/Idh/MocA family protein, partial [Streptococcus pyogenes]
DVNRPGNLQYKLFDFFIHPLDTALFLADDQPVSGSFSYHLEDGQLSQVAVTLKLAGTSIVASMNLQSGSRRELMEVQTPQSTYQLKNLDELKIYEGTRETLDA